MTVTEAGRIVQTFTFTSTITSIIVSFIIKWTKRYKKIMVLGTLLYFLGLVLMNLCRTQDALPSTIIATQVFLGVGGSLTHVPAQLGVQASATHAEVAAATALFLTFLEIGGAVGSAISGAIWTTSLPHRLAKYLPAETQDRAAEIYGNIDLASKGWPMGSPTRNAINRAYQETMTNIMTVAVCVAIPCIVLSLLMKDYKLDEIDQGVKGLVIGSALERPESEDTQPLFGASTGQRGTHDNHDDDDDDDYDDNEAPRERHDSQTPLIAKSGQDQE